MSSFASVRSQAVSLETQASGLLSKYSSYALSTSSEATGEETKLEKKIEQTLHKSEEVLDSLSRISDSTPSLPTVKLQQLTRHKEILQDNWRQFGKIRSTILSERNKINLLFNVQSSIDDRKNRPVDEMDYTNEESQRANALNNIADDLISRAYETRDNLLAQRSTLQSAGTRLTNTLSTIPGVNVLISKINTRRKRDALILATLIAVCIVLLFFTW